MAAHALLTYGRTLVRHFRACKRLCSRTHVAGRQIKARSGQPLVSLHKGFQLPRADLYTGLSCVILKRCDLTKRSDGRVLMPRFALVVLAFTVLASTPTEAQTGAAAASGQCSLANSASGASSFTIDCGTGKEQADKILSVLNHALETKTPKQLMPSWMSYWPSRIGLSTKRSMLRRYLNPVPEIAAQTTSVTTRRPIAMRRRM